jgi:hypothetical protein
VLEIARQAGGHTTTKRGRKKARNAVVDVEISGGGDGDSGMIHGDSESDCIALALVTYFQSPESPSKLVQV